MSNNTVKLSIGIDPGKDGFIVAHNDMQNTHYFFEIPKLKGSKVVDMQKLNKIFSQDIYPATNNKVKLHCAIEEVHALNGASAKSTFEFGRIVGVLEGFLYAYSIPFTKVAPKVWQKEMWIGVPKQKKQGSNKTDTKLVSKMAAKRLFPEVSFKKTTRCTSDDHNKIDAMLLCEYCRRYLI